MGNFDDLLEFLKTSVKLIFANININIVNISATDNSCTTKSCSHLNKFKTRVFLYDYFSFQNSSATEAYRYIRNPESIIKFEREILESTRSSSANIMLNCHNPEVSSYLHVYDYLN